MNDRVQHQGTCFLTLMVFFVLRNNDVSLSQNTSDTTAVFDSQRRRCLPPTADGSDDLIWLETNSKSQVEWLSWKSSLIEDCRTTAVLRLDESFIAWFLKRFKCCISQICFDLINSILIRWFKALWSRLLFHGKWQWFAWRFSQQAGGRRWFIESRSGQT